MLTIDDLKNGKSAINEIINGDSLEILKLLPDNYVNCVITSPPYNAGNNVRGNFYDEYSDNLTQDEYYTFISIILKDLIRVTKHYVFFNFQILSNNKLAYLRIMNDFKENIKDIIIWHKKQVQPSIQEHILNSSFEFILVFTKKEFAEKRTFERCFFNNRKKGQLNNNVIYGNNAAQEIKYTNNKATFPEYLVQDLLDKFSDKNDIILDPFAGGYYIVSI